MDVPLNPSNSTELAPADLAALITPRGRFDVLSYVADDKAFVEDIRSVTHVSKDVHDLSTVKA